MLLFVICHDEKSFDKASQLCQHWLMKTVKNKFLARPLLVPHSPYMESYIYKLLIDDPQIENWETENYVGIVTYSILAKLTVFRKTIIDIDWDDVISQAENKSLHFIGILAIQFKRGSDEDITLIESGIFHHGFNFYRAWRSLLLELGYNLDEIENNSQKTGFFCNWIMCTPTLLKSYCQFIKKAMDITENNELVKKYMFMNSHYGVGNTSLEQKMNLFGKPYYTLHPFVFERLLSYYISHVENNMSIGHLHKIIMHI